VSAAATAGSIAGTFLTGFALLPLFPLPVLLALTAASLLALAAVSGRILGGGPSGRSLAVAAAALGVAGWMAARPAAGTLHAEQTLYSAMRVTEREWANGRLVREMLQNGGSSSAEYVDTRESAHEYVAASLELLEPVVDDVNSMLVLGGAALTMPVVFQKRRPGMRIDVVEIDPAVTELAERYFAYGEASYPNIRVHHEDGRVWLRRSAETFDVVYLDVFDHLLTVPWTMVTEEALADMARRLEPEGLFVANVLSPLAGPGVAFLERFRATLREVFAVERVFLTEPDLHPTVTQNVIVVASHAPRAIPAASLPEVEVGAAGRPLTDAWAPVEYLQAKVFVSGLGWR
jgi:spermidine synthase